MIVITGASGRIGSKTAAMLLARGKKVRVISRQPEKLKQLKEQGAIVAIGDMLDGDFLAGAFQGAEAVLLMIPPSMSTTNIAEFQAAAVQAQIDAVIKANVKNIVLISSLGADAPENGSLVDGLALEEKKLNALPDDVNVISLRPTGFMENFFTQAGSIKNLNSVFSPLDANLKTGIIATHDIATVAADKLEHLSFRGKTSLDLLGSRDYSQREMVSIVGAAIGKPDLAYVQVSFEENKKALVQNSISESVADAMVAMLRNINNGLSSVKRTPENTTPTTLEYFAEHCIKPVLAS